MQKLKGFAYIRKNEKRIIIVSYTKYKIKPFHQLTNLLLDKQKKKTIEYQN